MRDVDFVNGNYYHVFNRGTDKRQIFQYGSDYERFYESLFLFNDANYASPGGEIRRSWARMVQYELDGKERQPLVSIISFCLIPNHFHSFLRQETDQGISKFLHRLSMGYTKYFNLRYSRTGHLFESAYKIVPVEQDAHFTHLSRYIHLNALDGTDFKWREGAILPTDWPGVLDALNQYRWSSHHVYMGEKQKLQVVNEDLVREFFTTSDDYVRFLNGWTGRFIPELPITE